MELTKEQVLAMIPHGRPFRFVDEIIDVSEEEITAKYTFREDEFFYEGHFPGNPITPGVILVECMAQICMTGMGFYRLMKEIPEEDSKAWATLQTEIKAEFMKPVRPGETVTVYGKMDLWRRRKLRANATMTNAAGEVVATATLAGLGVKRR